jgi:hypothetical protein
MIDGARLNVNSVAPKIEFCRDRSQRRLFRLCSLLQNVPVQRLLFRQIAAIVRDEGNTGRPIIGAFGLASPLRSMKCRDRLLGWNQSSRRRVQGLRHGMQLSVCIAMPPYTHLRAGKLVAALAASQQVADEFARRYYPDSLQSITTTSARGLHSPIFNRIMIRRGGLYRRIGETEGFSTMIFGHDTLQAAQVLVSSIDGSCSEARTMQTLNRALDLCNVSRRLVTRLGLKKGIYLTTHSQEIPGSTCSGWPSEGAVVEYWRTQVVPKCVASPQTFRELSQFSSKMFINRAQAAFSGG